jgi:hypothetical protein
MADVRRNVEEFRSGGVLLRTQYPGIAHIVAAGDFISDHPIKW